MHKILVSWIGHTDLLAMLPTLEEKQANQLRQVVKNKDGKNASHSPIKTLLESESFDEIHLIDNYSDKAVVKWYLDWLGHKAKVHKVVINNPTDYEEIFQISDSILTDICSRQKQVKEFSLSLLLTSGTPTMAAVFVLLGKTKYPAVFWQTHKGSASETKIPYDLTSDLLPDLLHKSDSAFHHLSALSPQECKGFENIIGNSRPIRLAVGRARRAALRDVSILLLGESGTGKELFARAIHEASRRKGKPFVPVNCAAIPPELMESELFGHVKGAFTDAKKDKSGAFAHANNGTLFLDEIGECPLQLQAKLLRVLQPPEDQGMCVREFQPVGAEKVCQTNVRIIAATNRNLLDEVKSGRFRDDLYYRLSAITVKLPALRQRKEDIVSIAEHILHKINKDFRRDEPGYEDKYFSVATKKFIQQFSWPGNVRELGNAILQAVVMSESEVLTPQDIDAALMESSDSCHADDVMNRPLGDGFSLDDLLNSIKIRYLKRAKAESGGMKRLAAELLGYKNYQKLDTQLQRFEIDWNDQSE